MFIDHVGVDHRPWGVVPLGEPLEVGQEQAVDLAGEGTDQRTMIVMRTLPSVTRTLPPVRRTPPPVMRTLFLVVKSEDDDCHEDATNRHEDATPRHEDATARHEVMW